MSAPKLYYFDTAGLAESIRLAFVIGGLEFEDLRHTREQWPAMKPTSPTGTVPMLEVDGVKYAESGAILAYACTKAGLWPSDPLDVLKMMQVVQYSSQIYDNLKKLYKSSDEERPAVLKMFMEESPAALDTLSQLIKMRKVDGSIDMADLILSSVMAVFEAKPCGADLGDIRTKWPAVAAAADKVAKNEKVKAYYASKH